MKKVKSTKTGAKSATKSSASRSAKNKRDQMSTREYLLEVAAKALLESGVHGLRYSQISKMADVPQPLMGYHFPTLEALMMEMVQTNVEKIKAYTTSVVEKHAQNPKKALEVYIRAPFDFAAKDAQFRAVWSAFYHLTSINKDFSELNRQVRAFGRERIGTFVTMALAMEKKLPDNMADLHRLTVGIQGIMTGLAIMAGSQTDGDFSVNADLAVSLTFQLLDIE